MIKDLELKLSGLEPVTREELITLVSSWGRKNSFTTFEYGGNNTFHIPIKIIECEPKECYNLSNLDVYKIKNLSYIFKYSYYSGDLSKWNLSNCKDINSMFDHSDFNNDSISNWDVSNVINMSYLFLKGKFDGNLTNWNFNKNLACDYMFYGNENFENKYNDGKRTLEGTKNILKWFEENREKMRELNLSEDKVLDFFSFDNKNLDLK